MGHWTQRARALRAQTHAEPPCATPDTIDTVYPTVSEIPAAEVAWRVAVLRPHVAPTGPIILPPVRDGVPPLVSQDPATGAYTYHTHCGSCGEPREPGQTYHCRACQQVRYQLLLELREGVAPPGANTTTNTSSAHPAQPP